MWQYILLGPLSILVNGFFLRNAMGRFLSLRDNFTSKFHESLLLGSSAIVIPMVFFGLFTDRKLFIVAFSYFAISLLIMSIWIGKTIIKFPNFLSRVDESLIEIQDADIFMETKNLQERLSKINRFFTDNIPFYKLILIANVIIIFDYAFLAWISPARGWDALHYYLPNSLFYYYSDDIPETPNPLNFIYPFKPPVNSILITYVFYISKGFYPQLIPVMFLMGLAMLTYDITIEIGENKIIAAIASTMLLISPFIYIMMYEFAFYQDLPIAYYISSGFLYYLRTLKEKNTLKNNFPFLAISFGMAPLTKVSGYSFPLILILSFPILKGKKDLLLKSIFIIPISTFLFLKSARNVYLGVGIAVIAIYLFVFIINVKMTQTGIPANKKIILATFSLALLTATVWIIHMTRAPEIKDYFISLYFQTPEKPFSYSFPKLLPQLAYMEHAHASSFWTTVFVIFLAHMFNLFLLPFKIWGIGKTLTSRDGNKWALPLLGWIFSFYGLWMGYFSVSSTRYLSMIIVPLTIITSIGLFSFLSALASISPTLFIRKTITSVKKRIYSDYNTEKNISVFNRFGLFKEDHRFGLFEQSIILFVLGTNYLFYLPLVPFNSIFMDPNVRLYNYHSNVPLLLIYLFSFIGLLWAAISSYSRFRYYFSRDSPTKDFDTTNYPYVEIEQKMFKKFAVRRKRIGRGAKVALFAILILSPSSVQILYLTYNNFDVESYQELFHYNNRRAVRELADFIIDLNLNPEIIMIGVNIPGIEYLTQRGFIDVWLTTIIEDGIPFNFAEMNISEATNVLTDYNIRIIISLAPGHYFYQEYMNSFVPRFPFFVDIEEVQDPIFTNAEFKVFII